MRPLARVGAVAAIALLLRLTAALIFPVDPAMDAIDYHRLGISISQGRGFLELDGQPSAFRPPVYPLVVAGTYGLFGVQPMAVRILQSFLDVGTCLLVWAWARRRLGERPAFWALVMAAVSLGAISAVRLLLSECLSAFLLTATLFAFDRSRDSRHVAGWWLLTGVLAGLLTLTRAVMIFLPAALVVLVLLRTRKVLPTIRFAALTGVVYGAVLAPWMVRNARTVGTSALTTQSGITFYSSHVLTPGQPYGVLTNDETTRRAAELPPAEASRVLTKATTERLKAQPWLFIRAVPKKLFYYFVPVDWEVIGYRVLNVTYLLVLVLAPFGFRKAWSGDRWTVMHSLTPLAYLAGMAVLFYGAPRFRLPAEPLLSIVAAQGVIRCLDLIKLRRSSPSSSPLTTKLNS